MPIIRSALKAQRQNKKKATVNQPIKSKYRQALKIAKKSLTVATLQKAYSKLDIAVKKGVIHKNKASRLKSRLAKQIKSIALKPVAKKAKKTG